MDNNEKTEGELKKKCPFSGEWCGDWCPLYVGVVRVKNGMQSRANMCVFLSTNMMISELNNNTQQQQQPAPRIHRLGDIGGN